MSSPLLRISNLSKRYGDFQALSQVNLDIEPGEIFALLGPNGAGKTTLIGCICGLVVNFEGRIDVAGFNVTDDYQITRRLIGLVPQELNYDAFFSVLDSLRFQGGYFGVRDESGRAEQLLQDFALADKAHANARWLSGGMKRRLMICKALMHRPALLFLDEPTAGVDVELREELWEYVRRLRDQGTTIVLTTHYIEEAEELADRIGILYKGNIQRVSPRQELMAEFDRRSLEVTLTTPLTQDTLRSLPGDIARQDTHSLVLHHTAEDTSVDTLLRALSAADLHIASLTTRQNSLEEIFRSLIHDAQNP